MLQRFGLLRPSFTQLYSVVPAFLTKTQPPKSTAFLSTTSSDLSKEQKTVTEPLTAVSYEHVCNTTLDSLAEHLEEVVEKCAHLTDADVSLGDGVLTVQFGPPHGTYVINRQRPNLQLWLSSPTSGPKRYDFLGGRWVYKHDGVSLHALLEREISKIVRQSVDLSPCAYSS